MDKLLSIKTKKLNEKFLKLQNMIDEYLNDK